MRTYSSAFLTGAGFFALGAGIYMAEADFLFGTALSLIGVGEITWGIHSIGNEIEDGAYQKIMSRLENVKITRSPENPDEFIVKYEMKK